MDRGIVSFIDVKKMKKEENISRKNKEITTRNDDIRRKEKIRWEYKF